MIDDIDSSASVLRLLVSEALKRWESNALINLLKDDDVIVRTAVARELQYRGENSTFLHMQRLLHSRVPFVREIAVFVLGQLGTPSMPYAEKTFSLLLKSGNDNDAEVRAATAAALGHLCYDRMPKDIEGLLLKMSADDDSRVRSCVAYALGNSSGDAQVKKALKRLQVDKEVKEYARLGLDIMEGRKVKRRQPA